MQQKNIGFGIQQFSEFREKNCYYVDKTGFLRDFLHHADQVNLFTRPRGFGKTLTLDLLRCFFEPGTDPALFDGLAIRQDTELCEQYMGQYPVISLSLEAVAGPDFSSAVSQLRAVVAAQANRFAFLSSSEKLDKYDRYCLASLQAGTAELANSLLTLSDLLYRYYGKRVIFLIDDYDAPLANAYQGGYYARMANFLRVFLTWTLKTNPSLEFAVLTGTLWVPTGDLTTGLNNVMPHTLCSPHYAKLFGFTEEEVKAMLHYYDLDEHYDLAKQWYAGYRIGGIGICNPTDLLCWVQALRSGVRTPESFRHGGIETQAIDALFRRVGKDVSKATVEALISGQSIDAALEEQLSYDSAYNCPSGLWSLLFAAGCLTLEKPFRRPIASLRIPNEEIRSLFCQQYEIAFRENHNSAAAEPESLLSSSES